MKVARALLCLDCDEIMDSPTLQCPSCTNSHLILLSSLVEPLHAELAQMRELTNALRALLS